MAHYKVKSFDRYARKNAISDTDLTIAADEVLEDNADANLGGGVYKQRVARDGGGKSGGFRTIITHKTSEHTFFVYGFGKNERHNIDPKELKAFKAMAKVFGDFTRQQIDESIEAGELVEVQDEDDESENDQE